MKGRLMPKPKIKTEAAKHPTGIGTTIAAGLIAVLQSYGVTEFDGTTAALVVGAVAAVLSLLSPRFA
jgi:hypothetical protein